VTDLLETADYPVPQGWNSALDYALTVLRRLPRSKISVGAGRVDVTAISDSAAQRTQLETQLSRMAPVDVRLGLTIMAPRPVITPFTTRFTLDDGGARFDACAADTEEAQRAIIAAAIEVGAEGRISCTLGLGTPTRRWGEAVVLAIKAVGALGGGTVTFADVDVVLMAPEGTDRAIFDPVIGELANALPDVFALEAVLPEPPEAQPSGPQTFSATLSPEGQVQLRGLVADDLMNMTLENYAMARFGRESVTMGTRITEGLPTGWSVRMLAGVEALGMLENGAVTVTPDEVTIRGDTGNTETRAEISRLMIEKLGQSADFTVDVTYDEELDPVASLPTPEECVSAITSLTVDRKITFDPGSAQITVPGQQLIDEIAEILIECPEKRIEIAGYTDSQGRDEMNLELSQSRADAVLEALRTRRVPTDFLTAVGYGEAEPIADNETEAGREANRRIEFVLIEPEAVAEDPTALEEIENAATPETDPDPDAPAAE
jgi:OmpA-OmpF porin, OOP family